MVSEKTEETEKGCVWNLEAVACFIDFLSSSSFLFFFFFFFISFIFLGSLSFYFLGVPLVAEKTEET